MSASAIPFVGFVIGAFMGDTGNEWPETPSSDYEDGEGPRWMSGESWVGVFIAAHPREAAEALRCGSLGDGEAVACAEDAVREHFDGEASQAQEEWRLYRDVCALSGFDPGRGEVLFVSGLVPGLPREKPAPRRIYVASSWRNERHRSVVEALRAEGHSVYDYRNPAHGAWTETNRWWERPGYRAVSFPVVVGDVPERITAFATDMQELRAADVVVLVLDSGKSAHLEAGFAAGAGKALVVLGEDHHEPELMYGMADLVTTDIKDAIAFLAGIGA